MNTTRYSSVVPALVFVFFLILSIWQFYPFLRYPAFNLIDDGVSIRTAKELLSGDASSIIEVKNGRVRPLYWMYFAIVYLLSGTNPAGYWIAQMSIFFLTLFTLYLLVIENKPASYLHTILIVFSLVLLFYVPAVSENLFRLGTAEVRQMLLVFLYALWLQKSVRGFSSKFVGVGLLALALFTKETSILLAPFTILYLAPYLLSNYKKHKAQVCMLILCVLSSTMFYFILTALKETATYTASYALSLDQLKINFLMSRLGLSELYYVLILLITSITIRYLFFMKTQPKKIFKEVSLITKASVIFWKDNALLSAMLGSVFSSLFFVFSWEHQLERYYYPVYLFLVVVLLLELSSIASYIRTYKMKYVLLITTIPFFLIPLLFMTVFQKVPARFDTYQQRSNDSKQNWFNGYQNSNGIISYLLNNEFDVIYTSVDDYEVVYELGLYANDFNYYYNQVPIFSPDQAVADSFDYVEYVSSPETAFIEDNSFSKLFIATDKKPASFDQTSHQKQNIFTKNGDQTNWYVWKRL